jgi:hypothetical protein
MARVLVGDRSSISSSFGEFLPILLKKQELRNEHIATKIEIQLLTGRSLTKLQQ